MSNYPEGAEHDPHAPWNREEAPQEEGSHYYVAVDQKVVVWQRVTYKVTASSPEEVADKMLANKDWDELPDDIEYSGHQEIHDPEEVLDTDFDSMIIE